MRGGFIMHPDYKKNTIKVKNFSLLWVSMIWLMMMFLSEMVIGDIMYLLIVITPVFLLALYLKFKRRLTFLYHFICWIYTALFAAWVFQVNQVQLSPIGYAILWFFSILLIHLTYFIFSIGLTKKDIQKMLAVLGISFLMWPLIVMFANYMFNSSIVEGFAFITLFSLTGWMTTSTYLIAIGLSFQPKWFYQSALNAPIFMPIYFIISLFSYFFNGGGFMPWKDFLDLTMHDKRID